MSTAGDIRIPRVIHRLWLGPDPVPEIFDYYAETWQRHHPDWEMRLWTDATIPPLSCAEEFAKAKTFKSRYDVTRLELIRQFGGVIIDMDVEALRSIEPLLPGVNAFVGKVTLGRRMGNQILGAIPNHPLYEHAIKRLKETAGKMSSASQEAGPAFLSRIVEERPEDVVILPRDTFYSPLTIAPPKNPEQFPDIYAVHHHTESYRPGPEGEIVRLERRLHDAQREIRRLQDVRGNGSETSREVSAALKRLAMVTSSRWWRLGVALGICKVRD